MIFFFYSENSSPALISEKTALAVRASYQVLLQKQMLSGQLLVDLHHDVLAAVKSACFSIIGAHCLFMGDSQLLQEWSWKHPSAE